MFDKPVTLVLDVGKTRTKLLAIDADGELLESWQRDSGSDFVSEGYRALDTTGTEAWLSATLAGMGDLRRAVRAIVPITHGAAIAGLGQSGLALPIPDYEFEGFDQRAADFASRTGTFEETLSPVLPLGLNMATQLEWLQRHVPDRFAAVSEWLPYAQYWAWWLSGVSSSEVSSLGCHTLLWNPSAGHWSRLAQSAGWAARFAPVRRAWETLGFIRAELAQRLGLPLGVQILCGAHDSNACLARYLRSLPRMTLVSSGTWVVVMAPGTPLNALDGHGDFLANVSIRGDAVPTGRFMGGRDIERICGDADPALASQAHLRKLIAAGVRIHESGRALILPDARLLAFEHAAEAFDPKERATLAAWHAALGTAHCVQTLGALGPVTVDGPLSTNEVYLELLAALLPDVNASVDAIEGTARGGYVLARWTEPTTIAPRVRQIACPADAAHLQPALALAA